MKNRHSSLTAIILTYNEELHLQRCIDSIKGICEKIVVVDSYSTDKTKSIALANNANFIENPWVNYATQFNWALDNCNISTDWVLRIDADEYITSDLQILIRDYLENPNSSVNGVGIYLRRVFMQRHMKYGLGRINMLRLFRFGKARIESRWMDEHVELIDGETHILNGEFADDNLNSLAWWTEKHNGYSIREAIDLLDIELNILGQNNKGSLGNQAAKKRSHKEKYVKLPLFFRAFIYFVNRYFFKFGFLDGKEGFLWHFLQGWWYRTLVDAKIYEIKKVCGNDKEKIKLYIKDRYNINLDT